MRESQGGFLCCTNYESVYRYQGKRQSRNNAFHAARSIDTLDLTINCVNIGVMPQPVASVPSYTLSELCVMADLPVRTVRYYIQVGLVDRPQGETRAARYGSRHVEQLLLVKKWTSAGLSLERIRELLDGDVPAAPARPAQAGTVEVRSHLTVADGIELVIEPGRAGLSPEQVRGFARGVMALYQQMAKQPTNQGE